MITSIFTLRSQNISYEILRCIFCRNLFIQWIRDSIYYTHIQYSMRIWMTSIKLILKKLTRRGHILTISIDFHWIFHKILNLLSFQMIQSVKIWYKNFHTFLGYDEKQPTWLRCFRERCGNHFEPFYTQIFFLVSTFNKLTYHLLFSERFPDDSYNVTFC